MAPSGYVSFLAAQFTAIRMKQKGRWSALSFEAIEADSLRQSMVGDNGRAGYQPNMEVAWPK